jgi:hypothetical protein
MAAIRILQERSNKSQVKHEYAQTSKIPKSPEPPSRPPSYSTIIKPGTHVYAVWYNDDGLVYQVC